MSAKTRSMRHIKAWTELFDPTERDHATESMRQWLQRRVLGYDDANAAAETIEEEIQEPLNTYLTEHNERAQKLHEQDRVEWLARGIHDHPKNVPLAENAIAAKNLFSATKELIQAWKKPSTSRNRLNELIDAVFHRWTEFIVNGAAYRMYHDAPKEKKQRVDAAKKPRKSTQKIDRTELQKQAKLLLATGKEKHELAGILAPKFGVTARAIRNALPKDLKKKRS